MRRIAALLALVLVSALALWAGARLLAGGSAPRGSASSARAVDARSGRGDAPATEALEQVRPTDAGAPADEPRPAREERDGAPARARWIEGRVLLPAGTPADERLEVVASGPGGLEPRAPVAPDGRFRLAFDESARGGRLRLEARYLYLPERVRWERDDPSPIVLEPVLGGRVRARLRAPTSRAERAPEEGWVELLRLGPGGEESVRRSAHEPGLEVLFDAVPPSASGQRYRLAFDGAEWVGTGAAQPLEAGRTLELELELRPGIVLAGRVRDADGTPLEGVRLGAVTKRRAAWTGGRRSAQSDADGAFRLGALEPGEITLEAELADRLPLRLVLERRAESATPEPLELVLASGLEISGRVQWPDGRPAEARVELFREGNPRDKGWFVPVRRASDAAGRFRAGGLTGGTFRVVASALRPEAGTVEWNAEASAVAAGARELVLVLGPSSAVSGWVRDELGSPLDEFVVSARRVETSRDIERQSVRRSFRKAAGRFELTGLLPGTWELAATSPGYGAGRPELVTLPSQAPVTFLLAREARATGRVLDPAGQPVEGALVRHEALDSGTPGGEPVWTDAEGRFELEEIPPGRRLFLAHAERFAPSAVLELDLVAGQSASDLVLVLRPEARLLGEFLGPAGLPEVRAPVRVRAPRLDRRLETDEHGAFELGGLAAGELELVGTTEAGIEVRAQVELEEGATVRVRLEAPAASVRVRGTVLAGGEPLAGARLSASPSAGAGGTDRDSVSAGVTDELGAYELTLPGPGEYLVAIHGREAGSLSWRTRLEVPAVAELRHDLVIPLGRISGRVLDARGAALARIHVASTPEQHEGGDHGSAWTLSGTDGRYELRVPPGRHAVEAGGTDPRGGGAGEALARTRVEGVVVPEAGHVDGVDLVLEPGGVLAGIARLPDGSGAQGAILWRADGARGQELGRCDAFGRFRVTGVPPGPHRIGVRAGASASALVSVEVRAEASAEVELALRPATRVHLTVTMGGQRVGSEIRAFDARGESQAVESGANGEAWIGPLLPGRYTVRVERDGQRVERELELAGGSAPLELALVLD